MLRGECINNFAELLEAAPLRLSSFEQVSEQLSAMGISHRLAAHVRSLDQEVALRTADAEAHLEFRFPGGPLPVQLRSPRQATGAHSFLGLSARQAPV